MIKSFLIPIYNVPIWIVVGKDIRKARSSIDNIFGPGPEFDYVGLCCHNSEPAEFALVFSDKSFKDIGVVAHEIFHLTHRILEWAEANFDADHHEQGALLNEYLTYLVYKEVKKYAN